MKPEVSSIIGRLITDAQQTEASQLRADLFDRYMGEPYGDEVKGRSSFVSSDVADAVEAILPDLMDVFTAAENMVMFAPVGKEDEEGAQQETEVVSHIFWQKNPGFEILYTWIKEALIQQNSYVKRGWEDKERVEISEYADLDEQELVAVVKELEKDGAQVDILDRSGGLDPVTGMFTPVSMKVRVTKTSKQYVIDCIPQEEFFVTKQWNRIGLEGVPCCGHKRAIEAGELRRMGFDEDSIEKATTYSEDKTQRQERFDTQDVSEYQSDTGDKSTRLVSVYEAYVRIDLNDDGKAELCRAWTTGDGSTLLTRGGKDAIEEVSCVPFSAFTPYIVPHRHVGRSMAELIDDIQKVKTAMFRHTFDNVYSTNYARPHFDETQAGVHLFNDLMNPAHGAPVRTGGAEVVYERPQSVVDTTLPIIQMMDDLRESRTGATRYNQGLDAESLNKTASGIRQIMNASQKKTLLIARVFAETAARDLFLGVHRDLRSGPMKELAVKLRGQWVSVNPRVWADRTDMTVAVGMGSGDRDEVRAGLAFIASSQEKLLMGGSRMVQDRNIYNTIEKMASTFGFKSIEDYVTPPEQLPPEPPAPPPPEQLLAQKQMQIMEDESKGRMMLDVRKNDQAHERELEKLRIQAEAEKRQHAKTAADIIEADERISLDRRKLALDDDFRRDQLEATTAAESEPPGEDE